MQRDKKSAQQILIRRYMLILMFAWTSVVGFSLSVILEEHKRSFYAEVYAQAKSIHTMDMAYSTWVISNGGVYVPVTEQTSPSTYLQDVPERDVVTPSGKVLTLVNSSDMTRQVHQLMDRHGAVVRGHIASLNPTNPLNKADQWETEALKTFEQGRWEAAGIARMADGRIYFRYMQPMVAGEACLKCHDQPDYKEKNVRGGISVSIPVDGPLAIEDRELQTLLLGYGSIWLLGMALLFFGGRRQQQSIVAVEKSAEEVRLLANSIAHAIYGLNINGECTFANAACVRMLGYEREEQLLGKNMHALMHHTRPDGTAYPVDACPTHRSIGDGNQLHIDEEILWRRDGSGFPAEYWSYPIVRNGECLGAVATFLDMTARKQAEVRFRKIQKSLAEAQRIAHVGSWELDLASNTLYWSDEIYRIFEIDAQQFDASYEAFLDAIHPEDRALVNKAYSDALQNRTPYRIEHRLLMKDGRVKYVLEQGETVYDKNGNALRSTGTVQDVSELKRAETALRESKEQYDDMAKRIPAGIYLYRWSTNGACGFDYVSPRFCQILDLKCAEVLSNAGAVFDHVVSEDRESLLRANREVVAAKQPLRWEGRFVVRAETRWIKIESDPTLLPSGECLWNGVVTDITERKLAEIALGHANRALQTLIAVNRELVHAVEEEALLQAICSVIVDRQGYRMAWVGYVRHDRAKSIQLMASRGDNRNILQKVRPSWAGDEFGAGPSGRAVRTGQTQITGNIATDSRCQPWAAELLKEGCLSSAVLPLRNGGEVFGILHAYDDEVNGFTGEEVTLLEEMAGDLAFGVQSLRIRQERDRALALNEQHLARMHEALQQTVVAISKAVEARDPYTAGHQRRVAELACAIARQMNLNDEQIEGIRMGATIHDIGKIQVPAEMLSKPSRLTELEYQIIKEHPRVGYEILKDILFPWPVAEIALQHHEHIDGSGYPQGLTGENICLEARIVSVADVVEAMSSHRPYRAGLGVEAALAEIRENRGRFYDAEVVEACLTLFAGGYQIS